MKSNKEYKLLMWFCCIVAIVSLVLTFVALSFGCLKSTSNALMCVMPVLTMIGSIYGALTYRKMARYYTETAINIDLGQNVLANWEYSDAEWQNFVEADYRIAIKHKWQDIRSNTVDIMPLVIIIIILAITTRQYIHIYLYVVLLPTLGFLVSLWLMFFLLARRNHRRNKVCKGKALITEDGVILNKKLHLWNQYGGNRLDGVYILEDSPAMIEFQYRKFNKFLWSDRFNYVRVPIPHDDEKHARCIIEFFENLLKESDVKQKRKWQR